MTRSRSGRSEVQLDLATVLSALAPADQSLPHQAVAHSRRGRSVHVENRGEFAKGLRALSRQDDEGSVLRQGHLIGHARQRASGHRDEDP